MPLAGIWAAREIGFPMVMLLSVAAGLVGSWALYLLGRLGGTKVMEFYFRKFPKQLVIEDKMQMLREKRLYRCVREQTAPDGADDHLDPGGNGAHGLSQIYGQFCMRNFYLESCVRRSRIFFRRRWLIGFWIAGGMRMKH